jgi:hypothetical protein
MESSYGALSNEPSTNEFVGPLIASASDRTLYVMVSAYTAFIDVELWCDLVPQLTSGQKLTLSIPTAGLAQQFYIAVPSSNMITCCTTGGSGDSDLYVKFGSFPCPSQAPTMLSVMDPLPMRLLAHLVLQHLITHCLSWFLHTFHSLMLNCGANTLQASQRQ